MSTPTLSPNAKNESKPTPNSHLQQMVVFTFCGSHFLIHMLHVSEVAEQPNITKLPCVVPWVKGLASIRGETWTIISLHEMLALPASFNRSFNRIIAIKHEACAVGVVVEKIIGLRSLDPLTMEVGATESCPDELQCFVSGVIELEGRLHNVFDPKQLFNHPQMQEVSAFK